MCSLSFVIICERADVKGNATLEPNKPQKFLLWSFGFWSFSGCWMFKFGISSRLRFFIELSRSGQWRDVRGTSHPSNQSLPSQSTFVNLVRAPQARPPLLRLLVLSMLLALFDYF